MEDHMPLQAADVLSWHLQRAYVNNLVGNDLVNVQSLNAKGICGMEFESELILEMERAIISRYKGEEQGNEGDAFSDAVSRLLKVPKSEVLEIMEKNKRLKRKKT
jgi:hypothetical protein